MRVVGRCHIHNKDQEWCAYCVDKQIEDCPECHKDRAARIASALNLSGHTRKEYTNAMNHIMKCVYCEDCQEALSFWSLYNINLDWPYHDEKTRKDYEAYLKQKNEGT